MNAWLCILGLMLLPLAAQQSLEVPVPPKPPGQVLDQARLFLTEPDRLELLSQQVSKFTERTGFEVQVVFFDTLIGVELAEQTDVLQDRWLSDGPGVVLAVVTDSGNWRLGWAATPEFTTEEGVRMPVLGSDDVAPQDQIELLNRMKSLPRLQTGSTEDAEALVMELLKGLDQSFAVADEKTGKGNKLRTVILGIGLLAGMLLIGLLALTWIRRVDRRADDRLVFPDVRVGQRLGASGGGGKISSRSFGRPSASDSDV